MIIITKFRLENKDGNYQVQTEEGTLPCPICGKVLYLKGWRGRKVIDIVGTIMMLIIRRLCCSGCKKIHHELPDFIVPYKRHCRETIEKIIAGQGRETVCEDSTIRRIKAWWTTMQLYFMSVLASLTAKYGTEFSKPTKMREVVRAVANAHLWSFTRSVFLSG